VAAARAGACCTPRPPPPGVAAGREQRQRHRSPPPSLTPSSPAFGSGRSAQAPAAIRGWGGIPSQRYIMRPAFKSRLPAWLWKPPGLCKYRNLNAVLRGKWYPLRPLEWSRIHVQQNNNWRWGHARPSPLFSFSRSSAPVSAVRRWKRCSTRPGLAPGEDWRISCSYRWSHHCPRRSHFSALCALCLAAAHWQEEVRWARGPLGRGGNRQRQEFQSGGEIKEQNVPRGFRALYGRERYGRGRLHVSCIGEPPPGPGTLAAGCTHEPLTGPRLPHSLSSLCSQLVLSYRRGSVRPVPASRGGRATTPSPGLSPSCSPEGSVWSSLPREGFGAVLPKWL